MEPTVVVNGREYPFITEADLTLGEAAEIEQITGQGYDLSQIGALGLLALTYISVKRVDGSVSIDEIRALKGEDIDVRVPEQVDPLPPPLSGVSAGKDNSSSESSPAGSGAAPEEFPEITGTPA